MHDRLPEAYQQQRWVMDRLSEFLARAGYAPVDPPVLERSELFQTSFGQELWQNLYTFRLHQRDLCMRPEFTASICRLYLDHYQQHPLPLRLQYAGPVFRYEAPGRSRYRQHNQLGGSEMNSRSTGAIAEGETRFLASLLNSISITFGDDDARREVVERFLWKMERGEQRRRILYALEFLRALHAISGSPPEVFGALRELLGRYELDPRPLIELEQLVAVIEQSGVPGEQILLNLALGRGVSYYTGLVFEIHALDEDGFDAQLCGGGRYDGLMRAVGGTRDVNACGFAFGVERLLPLVPESDLPTMPITQAIFIPVNVHNVRYDLQVVPATRP